MDVGHSRVNGGWAGIVGTGIGCLLVGWVMGEGAT
jgi:hypothetical protein